MKQYGKHTQFFEASELPKGVHTIPERSLLIAMLERAYLDHYDYRDKLAKLEEKPANKKGPNPLQATHILIDKLDSWFESKSEHPYSFEWICYHYDPLDFGLADRFREAITKPCIDRVLLKQIHAWTDKARIKNK